MKKKTVLIFGIALGVMFFASGTIYGLAKYGVIQYKGLADNLYGRVEITVDPSNTGGALSIYKSNSTISVTATSSGNKFIISSLVYGPYTYQIGMPGANGQPCLGTIQNLSHYSPNTKVTYPKFNCVNNSVQQYWVLTGKVTSNNQAVSGAKVTVSNKYAISNAQGMYTMSGIRIPMTNGTNDMEALKNQQITVTKTGYTSLNLKVSEAIPGISNINDFVTQNQRYNPVLTADTVETQKFYSISGIVKDSSTNSPLAGVSVNGANPTDSSGKYQINNLPFNSASTQTLVFTKNGYQSQTKTLSELGLPPNRIIPNQPTAYGLSVVVLGFGHTATFSLQGTITDESNNALQNATITLECPEEPVAKRNTCLSLRPNGVTSSATSKSAFTTTLGTKQNYYIDNIYYNIAQQNPAFDSYRLVVTAPEGYYIDGNNNNKYDAGEEKPSITLSKDDIKLPQTAGGKSFAKKDFIAKEKYGPTMTVLGRIRSTGDNIGGLSVSLECPSSPENEAEACRRLTASSQMSVSTVNANLSWNDMKHNYRFDKSHNIYNIASPNAEFHSYILKVKIESDQYYYDANHNLKYDLGENEIQKEIKSENISLIGKDSYIFNAFTLKEAKKITVEGSISLKEVPVNPIVKVKATGIKESETAAAAEASGRGISILSNPKLFKDQNTNQDNLTYKVEVSETYDRYSIGFYPDEQGKYDIFKFNELSKRNIQQYNGNYYFRLDVSDKIGDGSLLVDVSEALTDTKISGATVKITDPVCKDIDQGVTDANGKVYFDSDKFAKYQRSESPYENCLKPDILVTKSGYINNMSLLGHKQKILNVKLKKNDNQSFGTSIIGTVYSDSNKPITGATVDIHKGTNPSVSVPILGSSKTDQNGQFKITDLKESKYILSALKKDYYLNERSTIYLQLSAGENLEVSLYLDEPNYEEIVQILVLEKTTSKPIEQAEVHIKEGSTEIDNKKTDKDGTILFTVKSGSTYVIEAKKSGVPSVQTISIPADFWKMDNTAKEKKLSEFVIFLDLPSSPDALYPLIMQFFDKDTKEPLNNVQVNLYYGNMPMSFDVTDSYATAKSKADGKVSFYKDFTSSRESIKKIIANKKEITLDEQYLIDFIPPSGYIDKNKERLMKLNELQLENHPDCPKDVPCYRSLFFSKENISQQASLTVTITDPFSGESAIELVDNLILQKYDTKKKEWADFGVSEDNVQKIANMVTFRNLPAGKYRPKINVVDVIGDSVDLTLGESGSTVIGVCTDGSSAEFVNAGDNDKNTKFAFIGTKQLNRYRSDPKKYRTISDTVERLRRESIDVGPLLIIFDDNETINASSEVEKFKNCGGYPEAKIITINKGFFDLYDLTDTYWNMEATVTHEYGHLVYGVLQENQSQDINVKRFVNQWESLYSKIFSNSSVYSAVFSAIKDGLVGRMISGLGGHPEDNPDEFFASFYTDYFALHDRFLGIIKNNCDSYSPCQNVLAYAWNLFAYKIGTVSSDDKSHFPTVNSAVLGTDYTYDQIINGHWRPDIYNKMTLPEKAKVQYNRLISSTMNSVIKYVNVQVVKVNEVMNKLISSLGLLGDAGTANLTIKNKQGKVVPGLLVQVGPKFGITDSNGKVSISGIPSGDQEIIRIEMIGSGVEYTQINNNGNTITIPKKGTVNKSIQINL